MKKVIFASMVLLLCALFFTGGALAAEKFAYADLSRLFSEYAKTKEYDKNLTEKQNAYRTEIEKKTNEVKQFQDKMNLLSDKEKEAKKEEFGSKIKAFQEFDREKQIDLRKEFSDKTNELKKDIDDVIKRYAENEGYTLVFNEAGVAYNAKNLDITDKVLDILNKGYKK